MFGDIGDGFLAEIYKIDSRGAKSPQSELGYIAPDSLFCFSLPRIDIMTAVFAVNQ